MKEYSIKKKMWLVVMMIFAFGLGYAQPGVSSLSISNGKWVSEQDSLSAIVVKDGAFYAYYKGAPKNNVAYTPTTKSCNSGYVPKKVGAFFLLWQDGVCYEVEGSADEYIKLINTGNGKTNTYVRH